MSKKDVSLEREPAPESQGEEDAPPPVFGTWPRFYAVVVLNTLLTYLLLVLFSAFAR